MEYIMYKTKFLKYFMLVFMFAAVSSCGDNDKDEPTQATILGKWVCYDDAYGEPWDEPLIMAFDEDLSGYQWFSDEPFSDRWEFSYNISGSKLRVKTQGQIYNLRFELSTNGKNLAIFGWDDDDMEELYFVKE